METLTLQDIATRTPSAMTAASLNRSAAYAHIPTFRIIEAMQDRGFFPVKAMQARTRVPERRDYAKHIIRFRADMGREIQVNDYVPEIVLTNSHDGGSAYKMFLGIFRLVCSNGLVVGENTVQAISIRHMGARAALDNILGAARDLSDQGGKVIDLIAQWKGRELDGDEIASYAQGAAEIYQGKNPNRADPSRLAYAYRQEDYARDLWTTFNKVQENIIKGRLYTESPAGRYRRGRAITSIDRGTRINRELWDYTQGFARN